MRLLLLLAFVPLTAACVEGDHESVWLGEPVVGVGQLSFDEDGGADDSDTGPQDGNEATPSEESQDVPPGTYTFEEFVALQIDMSPEFAEALKPGSSGPPPADQDLVEVVPTPAPAGPCGIALEPSAPSVSPSEPPAALWEIEVPLDAALAALQPSDLDTLEGALESLSRIVMPLPEEPEKVVEPW